MGAASVSRGPASSVHFCSHRQCLWFLRGVFACLLAINFGSSGLAQTASFQGLGFVTGFTNASRANGVSADGTNVVGTVSSAVVDRGFRWANGTMTLLPCNAACTSSATAVNSDGTVVVGEILQDAVRWVNDTPSALGALAGFTNFSTGTGVSSDGKVIVGYASANFGGPHQAFRWVNGTISGLGFQTGGNSSQAFGVNADGTVIVGGGNSSGGTQAFRWVNGTMSGLGFLASGDAFSTAYGVDADGTVVVGATGASSSAPRPFRWVNGKMFGFGFVLASSSANSVNADGTVAVGRIQGGARDFAYRWTPVEGIRTLEQLLTDAGVSFTGWQLTTANGVSADGRTIVGSGIDPNGKTQGWIAKVPLPSLPTSIVAAVAPNARTGTVTGPAVTGFATIINAGTATANQCSIGLPGGVPAILHYQRTDAQNVPIGTQDTPVDIGPAGIQTFVFSIKASAAFSQDIPLVFRCFNTSPAPVFAGLNTFLVSISNTAISDMLSIADTLTHDGIANIPGTTGTGLIVTAAVNIGAAAIVVFTPSDTPVGQNPRNLPVSLSICQTNPSTGACINPATPGASSTVTVAANQTVFFSVFIQGNGTPIPFDPANSRVFIIGKQATTPVGEAGAAIRTQ